jgi:hypothetical protein
MPTKYTLLPLGWISTADTPGGVDVMLSPLDHTLGFQIAIR